MNKLSVGCDSTWKNWRILSEAAFGPKSPQVKFIDERISESPNGEDEEVVADERQLLNLLTTLK